MPFLRKSLIIPAFVLTILIYTLFNGVEPKDQLSIDLQKKPGDGAEKAEKPANANTDTRVHWQTRSEKYPVETYLALPTGRPEKIPKIQYDFPKERSSDRRRRLERQAAVKEAFVHAWDGYKQYAWLKDEVSPIKAGYLNSFAGWAATLVDTLDALLMLDMTDEFEKALEALDSIDFTTTEDLFINVFETTIRYLGGFMAAYDLSNGKYPVLLKKATEVADLLYGAFDTPNRMQVTRWEWQK
jgi:mannosyl-oligosaccharide alpha-1,2-mannosidase